MNAAAQVKLIAGRRLCWRRLGGFSAVAMLVCAAGCGDSSLPAAPRSAPDSSESNVITANGAATQAATARTGKTATTAAAASTATTTSTATPLAPDNRPTPRPTIARSQAIRDITFDTVKLDMKKEDAFKRSLITPAIEKLDGSRIRIRGYILPPFQQTGLTRFVLVRDNMACCFGPGAAIYDSMIVELKTGLTTDYTVAPVAVEGTFNIREVEGPGGRAMSIYRVLADKVE
jgi:hypothetical protein